MTPDLLSRFQRVKQVGDGWSAACPSHEDKRNSLSVNVGDDGRILIHCHRGCDVDAILEAVHAERRDLFPTNGRRVNGGPRPRIVATYPHCDADGVLQFESVRFEPKDFRLRRPDPNNTDRWLWKLGDVRRIPYRIDRLANHAPDLWIAEGHKDADHLWSLGLSATTSPQGASDWRNDYTDDLIRIAAVERVFLVPDHDVAGWAYVKEVAASFAARGVAARIVTLPGLHDGPPAEKHGRDLSDWLQGDHTADDLKALASAAPVYVPPTHGTRRDEEAAGAAAPTADDRLTEAGAAERFARLHGQDVRYDHRRDRWLLWSGHRWVPDVDAAITRRALAFARDWQRASVDLPDRERREATFRLAIRLERRDALRSMLKLAADLRPIADAGEVWDPDPWLLATPGGIVDLRDGSIRPGRRADRITLSTSVAYDPTAQSARWDQAIREILGDDDTIAFVQTALGYSATGETRRDCWFLGQGSGRNGKGTIYHPVRRALGDYAAELPAAVFDARRDAAPYDLAVLPGKRFVVSSEAGDTIKINHDRIKQLSGGDPLRVANKYERSFEFQPVCKLWLCANRKPRVTDDGAAFWARVMLVPFNVSFAGREDRSLRPDLEHDPAHQAAILAWLVQGAIRYYARGLDPPGSVQTATDQYREESDPLSEFLDEACRLGPTFETGASDIYQHYRRWADTHALSERERLTASAFGRRLTGRFACQRRRGGKVYLGLDGQR